MKILKRIVIILILAFIVNVLMPVLNIGDIYYAKDLPSVITTGDIRFATDELNEAGNLTFGPYIKAEKGVLKVTVHYETDTDRNFIDVYSDTLKKTYHKEELSKENDVITFTVDLPENCDDLEIRTFYSGVGDFRFDKMMVVKRSDDLVYIIIVYDILLLIYVLVCILFYLKQKKDKKKYE